MLTHIVCFKYHPETPESARQDHRRRLRGLSHLQGIVDLVVGEDVVRSARSYHTGLIVMFQDRDALDAYQVHPEHVTVAQLGASICEHILTVDF